MAVISPSTTESTDRAARSRPVSMVERMTLIMDTFERRYARRTLEEVARGTDLPRSTAHRILEQLVRLHWLEHTESGYGLGKRALAFGGEDAIRNEVRAAAAPLLAELHGQTGLVVHLAVLEGADVLYLDKIGDRRRKPLPSRVGGRMPAHATAIGKAMLAWHSAEHVETTARPTFLRRTDRTIGDLATLHQELNRVRQRRGIAFERGESSPTSNCVGAAVRGSEGPVAAISLACDEWSIQLDRVAPLVAAAARQVSQTIFPRPTNTHRSGAAENTEGETVERTWSADALNRFLAAGRDGEWM